MESVTTKKALTYADAGVNIDAGNKLIDHIKPLVQATNRPGTNALLGGFGGIFDLAQLNYKDPLLISTTDGVGTKLKIAQKIKKHTTIGIDLVAMCVNDLLAQGAEPLFFLDYFSTSKLCIDETTDIISSIVNGCKEANCALIGGETAEMPGIYAIGEYDLAGFAVGIAERSHILPKKEQIKSGDLVLGLTSSGIHANGFSLVHYLINQHTIDLHKKPPFNSSCTSLYDALLEPTKIYVQAVLPLIKQNLVKAIAHITGGGLLENIPRVLPNDLDVELNINQWNIPPIFQWIKKLGLIEQQEMFRTFNMGIGMILILAEEQLNDVQKILHNSNEKFLIIGNIIKTKSNTIRVHIN